MIMNQILYYPGILIPNDWIKKTILYSDKVSSIYPRRLGVVEGEDEQLALSNMEFLESLDLYEYTDPEEINNKTHSLIFSDLYNMLNEGELEKYRELFNKNRVSYEIYLSKVSYDVRRYFLDNKIARYNRGGSLLIEPNVGMLYMSILAFHAANEKNNFVASTDTLLHQNLLYDGTNSNANDIHKLILKGIPSISSHTSIEEIIAFKKKRERDLILFKSFVDGWVEIIKTDVTKFDKFKEEYEKYCDEINKIINDAGYISASSTLEVIIPPLALVAGRYFSNSLDGSTILDSINATTASLAFNQFKLRVTRKNNLKNNPLSYLYYTEKEFK